jgi:hypothetical protein
MRRSALALLALALLVAAPAHAVTTYTLGSGRLSITVDEYSPDAGRIQRAASTTTVDIASVLLTVDPDLGLVLDFDLSANPQIEFALPTAGSGTLVVESFGVSATSGRLVAGGAGFTLDADVDVSATFAGAGPYGWYVGEAVPVMSAAVGPGPIYGNLDGGGAISLAGVARGVFQSPFNGNQLIVTGDFTFTAIPVPAPVPEPDAALLFLAGLGVAFASAKRRPGARRARVASPL